MSAGRNDALIALSALQVGASLVTHNVKDFELLRRSVPFDLEPIRD
jgi:predicted nucleic acid-binding protein